MGVELALKELGLGPRGGDMNNPKYKPEWRRASHNGGVAEDGVIGFHDPREDTASVGLLREQPWHRMAAVMLNKGFTNIEIAEMAGVNVNHLSHLRAQRWFNELCVRLATDTGDALQARLDAEASQALENISQIANADAKEVGSRTKLAANIALLEHANGKPTQKILSVNAHTSYSSAQEEYAAIQSELEELRRAKAGAVVEKSEALHVTTSSSPSTEVKGDNLIPPPQNTT